MGLAASRANARERTRRGLPLVKAQADPASPRSPQASRIKEDSTHTSSSRWHSSLANWLDLPDEIWRLVLERLLCGDDGAACEAVVLTSRALLAHWTELVRLKKLEILRILEGDWKRPESLHRAGQECIIKEGKLDGSLTLLQPAHLAPEIINGSGVSLQIDFATRDLLLHYLPPDDRKWSGRLLLEPPRIVFGSGETWVKTRHVEERVREAEFERSRAFLRQSLVGTWRSKEATEKTPADCRFEVLRVDDSGEVWLRYPSDPTNDRALHGHFAWFYRTFDMHYNSKIGTYARYNGKRCAGLFLDERTIYWQHGELWTKDVAEPRDHHSKREAEIRERLFELLEGEWKRGPNLFVPGVEIVVRVLDRTLGTLSVQQPTASNEALRTGKGIEARLVLDSLDHRVEMKYVDGRKWVGHLRFLEGPLVWLNGEAWIKQPMKGLLS